MCFGEENIFNINNFLERFVLEIDEESYFNLNRYSKLNMFGSNYRFFYFFFSNFVVSFFFRVKIKVKLVLIDKRVSVFIRFV